MSAQKTILFLGATGGCGLSALRRSILAGHICVALCRTPSKLTGLLPAEVAKASNLRIIEGNAHDVSILTQALVSPVDDTRLVDFVVSSIGAAFVLSKMSIDDLHVCEKGMEALFKALASLRSAKGLQISKGPHIIGLSSTGISRFGRDLPYAMVPVYHLLAAGPHKDKRALEDMLAASHESWTIIRPSFLTDVKDEDLPEAKRKAIRVGTEDPVKGLENPPIGYTISRDHVGKFIFEELLNRESKQYHRKAVIVTN